MRTSSARTAAAAALVLQIASSDARKLALLRKKNGNGSRGPAFLAPSESRVEVTPSWYGPEDGGYGASILWHRGGSDQDEDEVDGPLDEVEGAEQQTREETKIQVTSSVETSPPSSATPSELAEKASPPVNPSKKKSNAVGDPDGNSSDGETSDDEDELREDFEELERMILEQERLRRESGEEGDGSSKDFDTLIELAGRRDEMRRRISEMEDELSRRKAEDGLTDDESLDAEDATDEEVGESTSYSLTGTNLPREDGILKRSRRYKRGSIFKSKSARSRNASSTEGSDAGKPAGAEATPTTVDGTTFDALLISALGPLVHLPPPHPRLPCADGSVDLKTVDIAARRRLDRRTLYHGLLAEMGGSHTNVKSDDRNAKSEQSGGKSSGDEKKGKEKIDSMIRRRYLDPETTRQLKGALSLACQPSWRKRLVPSSTDNDENESEMWEGHRTGVCLYPDAIEEDDDDDAEIAQVESQAPRFFGPPPSEAEEVTVPATPKRVWRATMAQQETAGMALAHSLGCGLVLIDDELMSGVRERVAQSLEKLSEKSEEKQTIDPEELRNGSLIGHLCRLASEGKFGQSAECRFGRISDRMARDMELGLDDDNDDLAVESLRLMREDERSWFEPIEAVEMDETTMVDGGEDEKTVEESSEDGESATIEPLPLVLFLRSDSSPSLLRSKSSVESLARQTLSDDGIHLLMVGGNGVDASSSSLPSEARQGVTAVGRKRTPSGMGEFQGQSHQQQGQQQGGGVPFAFMSNHPPGSPEFNAQMQSQQGAFAANNANASGANDPDGSRRFNIFLARTVDPTGRPQIMGTIAPPQAGNLFPVILKNMAKENLRKMSEHGIDEDNEQQVSFMRQMEELADQAQHQIDIAQQAHRQQEGLDGGNDPPQSSAQQPGGPNAAFFNATITSPFGSEIFDQLRNNNGDGENGSFQLNPPPEHIRRALQDAMSGVIDRLAQMSGSNTDGEGSGAPRGIPLNIARAFSQVLSNETLRRGIAENLSRAAPALIDPRCQGVMLSVYVPPADGHPNAGMMPGDQYAGQQRQQNDAAARKATQQRRGQDGNKASSDDASHGRGSRWLNNILRSSDSKKGTDEASVEGGQEAEEDVIDLDEASADPQADATAEAVDASAEASPPEIDEQEKPSNKRTSQAKKSKREKTLDRARTLAVAAAAIAGSKKERADRQQRSSPPPSPAKLTPEQRGQRNLLRLEALCRRVPIRTPMDPVRSRSWEAWADREHGSVIFRRNRDELSRQLNRRGLGVDAGSGTRGAGIVLRQMMSVRDISDEIGDVIRCAVETEAGRSQKHNESPWGVARASQTAATPTIAADRSLSNFLNDAGSSDDSGSLKLIHPHSLESALSLECGVSPSPGSQGSPSFSSASGVMAGHRTREDLMALAQDKHERALVPNCVSPRDIGVTYDMIGGLGEVKELLRQSITYPLKFPHLYSEGIAREAVKGVLLFGPPGTGKTMLAKAVATEGGASFLSVDASSVENKWLGESEKNAKAVFTLARRLAPCVVFIDEVDSLLSSREGSSDDSAHGTLTSVKTTMMSEWDGLNSGTNGKGDGGSDRVVVIGSTNRPFDLDEAVLRRFPRRILVDLPDLETRREILEVTLSENRLGGDVNLTLIAERLDGYTGSDLKEVCREAVVQISHEQARMLDRGEILDEDDEGYVDTSGAGFQMLRPVTMKDFESAMRKLKRSVSETGRELAKVWEWNDEYGEMKKKRRDLLPPMMNMFL